VVFCQLRIRCRFLAEVHTRLSAGCPLEGLHRVTLLLAPQCGHGRFTFTSLKLSTISQVCGISRFLVVHGTDHPRSTCPKKLLSLRLHRGFFQQLFAVSCCQSVMSVRLSVSASFNARRTSDPAKSVARMVGGTQNTQQPQSATRERISSSMYDERSIEPQSRIVDALTASKSRLHQRHRRTLECL